MLCILNGMAMWTLKNKQINNLEAFEMLAYRRMRRICWMLRLLIKKSLGEWKTKKNYLIF